ncbi:MAG: elongation factor P [Rickettsiaceae bacterium]|nr:elongation factor P [Rickettsiaceae bacterium]
MKISANSIRSGNILVIDGELWSVSKNPEHTKPGKGGAYVQVEMKNLRTGAKQNQRFSSSENVEKAYLEQRDFKYLYNDGEFLVFMDSVSFDQINLSEEILGDRLPFLQADMEVKLEFFGEKPLNVILPNTLVLEISSTEPVIKGATVTSTYKPAILENGIKVMVPSYIESGQKIVVKTEDVSYVERAK